MFTRNIYHRMILISALFILFSVLPLNSCQKLPWPIIMMSFSGRADSHLPSSATRF